MKKLILLSVILLPACVHTIQPLARSATSFEQTKQYSDFQICEDVATEGQPGKFTSQAIEARKLNCAKVIENEHKRLLSVADNATVCRAEMEFSGKLSKAEIKKRGLNCDQILTHYYQEQQLIASQNAALAQERAARAAMISAFKPAPYIHQPYVVQPIRGPVQTTCRNTYGTLNCTTY